MNKIITTLLLGIFLISFASAINCTEDNDFTVGDDINLCVKGCQYRNESNLNQVVPCDSSVICKITSFYPNGSLISAYNEMEFDGNLTFNYSYGNSSVLGNLSGIYTSKVDCYRVKGWTTIPFKWSISDAEQVYETVGRHNPEASFISSVVDKTKEKVEEDNRWIYFGVFVVFLILIFLLKAKNFSYKKMVLKLKKDGFITNEK